VPTIRGCAGSGSPVGRMSRDNPKSVTLSWPRELSKRLAGFRSRWHDVRGGVRVFQRLAEVVNPWRQFAHIKNLARFVHLHGPERPARPRIPWRWPRRAHPDSKSWNANDVRMGKLQVAAGLAFEPLDLVMVRETIPPRGT